MNNPKDGALEVLVIPKAGGGKGIFSFFKKKGPKIDSVLVNKYIRITSRLKDEKDGGIQEKQINVDNFKVIKTPAKIDVVPRRLKVIVGKERMF